MLHLHVHWQPPHTPGDAAGILFWAETSQEPSPAWQRGRLAHNPKPRPHPFCASLQTLETVLACRGEEGTAILRLPSTRTGPRPAPGLIHSWELDTDTSPFLAPWIVSGMRLPPAAAWRLLLELPAMTDTRGNGSLLLMLGEDVRFWSHAAALAAEIITAQKLLPVLVPTSPDGKTMHARWLPVLDGPADGPRLAQLEAAMPPVCRAALPNSPPANKVSREGNERTPRSLLITFLNTTCDALARQWGRGAAPHLNSRGVDPVQRWLEALFANDPIVKASPAQLQALAASHRAWMRNLHLAGDAGN